MNLQAYVCVNNEMPCRRLAFKRLDVSEKITVSEASNARMHELAADRNAVYLSSCAP